MKPNSRKLKQLNRRDRERRFKSEQWQLRTARCWIAKIDNRWKTGGAQETNNQTMLEL